MARLRIKLNITVLELPWSAVCLELIDHFYFRKLLLSLHVACTCSYFLVFSVGLGMDFIWVVTPRAKHY